MIDPSRVSRRSHRPLTASGDGFGGLGSQQLWDDGGQSRGGLAHSLNRTTASTTGVALGASGSSSASTSAYHHNNDPWNLSDAAVAVTIPSERGGVEPPPMMTMTTRDGITLAPAAMTSGVGQHLPYDFSGATTTALLSASSAFVGSRASGVPTTTVVPEVSPHYHPQQPHYASHLATHPPLAGTSAAVAGGRLLAAPILQVVWQRLSVLVSLLLLQSLSQFVLEAYEGLITANVVVPLFLTMLVGAGGNAGNQAAVHAITGLVTGDLKLGHFWSVVKREFLVGIISSSCLFVIGFVRVYLYYTNEEVQPTPIFSTVLGVSLSLFLIVLTSVVLGSGLPFFLKALRMDVEHAAPMIQVVMDILGVCIACFVCSWFLPNSDSVAGQGAAAAGGGIPPYGGVERPPPYNPRT